MEIVLSVALICVTVLAVVWWLRPREVPVPYGVLYDIGDSIDELRKMYPDLKERVSLAGVDVTVHCGDSIRGKVFAEYVDSIALVNAMYLQSSGAPVPAKGMVIVERKKITSIQVEDAE